MPIPGLYSQHTETHTTTQGKESSWSTRTGRSPTYPVLARASQPTCCTLGVLCPHREVRGEAWSLWPTANSKEIFSQHQPFSTLARYCFTGAGNGGEQLPGLLGLLPFTSQKSKRLHYRSSKRLRYSIYSGGLLEDKLYALCLTAILEKIRMSMPDSY